MLLDARVARTFDTLELCRLSAPTLRSIILVGMRHLVVSFATVVSAPVVAHTLDVAGEQDAVALALGAEMDPRQVPVLKVTEGDGHVGQQGDHARQLF